MKVKTFKECCSEVAQKHKLGNSLVTGHKYSYYEEAANEFAKQAVEYTLEQSAQKAKIGKLEYEDAPDVYLAKFRVDKESILDLKEQIIKDLKIT